MDIMSLPKDKQVKWLAQRGWQADDEKPDVWIDPDTRAKMYFLMALRKAIENCRLPADMELQPDSPPAKF
jgi:hypothetical protein